MASSVSGYDGGYNHFKTAVDELEDQYAAERKRLRESADQNQDRLEANYKAATDDYVSDLKRTQENNKQDASDVIRRERQNAKAETDRVKNEYYDKFGRMGGNDADVMRAQLDSKIEETRAKDEHYSRKMAAVEAGYEERSKENNEKHARAIEENVRRTRDNIVADAEERISQREQQIKEQSVENRRKLDAATQEATRQIDFERSQAKKAIAEKEGEFSRRSEVAAKANENRSKEYEQARNVRSEEDMRAITESHTAETKELRDQAQRLQEGTYARYTKEKGQGMQDASREYEQYWRDREQTATSAYNAEIAHHNKTAADKESFLAKKNQKVGEEKDQHFADLITRVNKENRAQQTEMSRGFETSTKQLDSQRKRDKQLFEQRSDQMIRVSQNTMTKALEDQAKAFNSSFNRQKASDAEKVAHVERELQRKSDPRDKTNISPAAEEALRTQMGADQEKRLTAEFERNQASEDSIHKTYGQRIRDVIYEKELAGSRILREREGNHQDVQGQLMGHIRDLEEDKAHIRQAKDKEVNHVIENTLRGYAQSLEKQRREYEEMIEALRSNSLDKSSALRQELQFQNKMTHRTLTAKQSELIRDQDRKLSALKEDYEVLIEDVKAAAQKQVHDSERAAKKMLDEQARAYEQRLAVQEAQFQERDRYTAERHDEELSKIKRANALQNKKKS